MSRRPGRLRSHRRQGLAGVSWNGYTFLLYPLLFVTNVVIFVEHKSNGSVPFGIALTVIWIVAFIASLVVATMDDTREGTGKWFGDGNPHKEHDS